MEVQADASLDGRHDELLIEAFLPADENSTHDEVTDTTHVGLVIVRFDGEGTTQAGVPIPHAVEVCNGTTAQVLDISVTSSTGSSVALFSDTACTGHAGTLLARDADGDGTWDAVFAGDSDGDGLPDTGLLATGGCACFVVEVTPPSTSPLGTVDETIVTAQAMPSGVSSGAASLLTRVAELIELSPDHLFADGTGKYSGAGKSVFFPHLARNNGPLADVIDFSVVTPVNDAGWDVVLWSDPDGDGNIADGSIITQTGLLAPNGGMESFVVEVRIPNLTETGVSSSTLVTGTSARNPSVSATVADEVIVSTLSTYSDPLFTLAATSFTPCDTISVLATGLRQGTSYELLYADRLERTVSFVSPWEADEAGVAEDAYLIQPGDAAGTWVIEVREEGIVLGTRSILLDPSGTLYYDTASGTFVPHTEGDITRTQDLPRMDPGEIFEDSWTEGPVSYPEDGVYCVVVRVVVPCGAILARSVICFAVGSGVEDCSNGIDDDGDGLIDCEDPDCVLSPDCQEDCTNGIDDDGDGFVDCLDSDCDDHPACTETDCTNGIDDDGDGLTDCGDPDCAMDPTCLPETDCDDGIDNDEDTLIDCDDVDCVLDPACEDADLDNDGVPNGRDCSPLDPGAWAIPLEVPQLDVVLREGSVALLTWTDMSDQAGPVVVYDVITGLVSELRQDRNFARSECLATRTIGTAEIDGRRIDAAQDAYYYLVRALNACGVGPWGAGSSGVERVATACAP